MEFLLKALVLKVILGDQYKWDMLGKVLLGKLLPGKRFLGEVELSHGFGKSLLGQKIPGKNILGEIH
jgi:hypothetical protein